MKNSGLGPARDLMDRGGHAGDSAVGRQPGGQVGRALDVEQAHSCGESCVRVIPEHQAQGHSSETRSRGDRR
jgi:hypothetical protein